MTRPCVIFVSLCLTTLIGCAAARDDKHPAQKALSQADYQALKQEFTQPTAGQVQRRSYPIKQGNPPLAALVPAGNSVRVVSAANGQLIAAGTTDRDAIVSVDPKTGVTLGRAKLAPGPIASAQPVAIYIESAPGVPRVSGSRSPASPTTAPSK